MGVCSAPYFDSGIFITQTYYTVFTYYLWTQLYFINYILACKFFIYSQKSGLRGGGVDTMSLFCVTEGDGSEVDIASLEFLVGVVGVVDLL